MSGSRLKIFNNNKKEEDGPDDKIEQCATVISHRSINISLKNREHFEERKSRHIYIRPTLSIFHHSKYTS